MEDNTTYEDTPEELIIRFLDGYATPSEEKSLRTWLKTSSRNREIFEEMKEIWKGAGDAAVLSEIDLEADWAQVRTKLRPKTGRVRWLTGGRLKIAATIALLLISGITYLYLRVPASEIRAITLTDGSKVWLAPGSDLNHRETFTGDNREVRLSGKAYFEISHDPAHPFTISAGKARILVLGTSFNVIADSDSTEVIVASGMVQLVENGDPSNQVVLNKSEKGAFKVNQPIRKTPNDSPNYLSWKTNVLVFDGVPIEEALAELSAHYGTKIVPAGGMETDCKLSATFDNEKLQDVVEIIENSCQIQIQPWTN